MNRLNIVTTILWGVAGLTYISASAIRQEFIYMPIGIIHLGIAILYSSKVDK